MLYINLIRTRPADTIDVTQIQRAFCMEISKSLQLSQPLAAGEYGSGTRHLPKHQAW
jgi:hypothetical protein